MRRPLTILFAAALAAAVSSATTESQGRRRLTSRFYTPEGFCGDAVQVLSPAPPGATRH
jgi:hypothetical protein